MAKKIKQLVICALIAAIFSYLTAFARMAEASINIFGGGMTTSDFTVSDDFSSDFYIDQPLSRYSLQDGKLYAENGSVSSRIISQAIAYSSYNIGSAKLVVSDYTPTGGRIVYFLSNDNGQTWTQAQLNVFVNFNSTGKTLRWSAVISRQSPDASSPLIDSLNITYKYGYDASLYEAYDNQRINDLSTVANALNDFYSDYGVYPHVSTATAATAWNELMTLLSRNRKNGNYPYLDTPINDPLHDSDENITYSYDDLSSNEYVLTVTFQSEADYTAAGGFRGTYGNITCNYPTYCIGTVRGTFSGSNTSQVLGAYTTSDTTGSTTVSITRTNPSFPSVGLPLYSMIAAPLNNLIGRPVFKLGDYYETVNSTETTTNVSAQKSGTVAGASISKVASVATGTTGSLALSLLLSGIVTFLYMGYTKTGLFKKRDAWAAIRNNLADKNKFNFAGR
jgi:hypothetical protein